MKRALLYAVVFALASVFASAQTATPPTIVLTGGKVFTNDPAKPWAQAVAIRDDKIAAVGTDEEIRALAGPNTKQFALKGRVVVPGFNDAHTHPGPEPRGVALATSPDSTWSDVKAGLAWAADETSAETWIFATLGGPVMLDETVNARALDTVAPNRKVALRSFTGHGLILSTAAMRALKLAPDAPDPAGGWYGRTDGKIDGRVFEYAHMALEPRLVELTNERSEIVDFLRAFSDEAVRYGITSVQAMPVIAPPAFAAAWRSANSPLRLRLIAFPTQAPAAGRPFTMPAGTNGLKWILDGTPIEHGAAVRTDYPGGGRGRLNFASLKPLIAAGVTAKEQLLFHTSGDAAIRALMDELMATPAVDWATRRTRLEHADGLLPDLIPDAKRLGLIVVTNPAHYFAREAYPKGSYMSLRSIVDAGIPVAIGSDGPLNPFLNMTLAVNRPDLPAEALTREQAVRAYTFGSAYAENREKEKGALMPGQLADLAVLSQDIFTVTAEILPDTRSVLTIINGKVVHSNLP